MSVLLITGGTGSFGSTVVKKYLKVHTHSEIRIFSRDEKKQYDMRNQIKDSRVKFFLGDVRDASTLVAPMKNADYVFHAAALKQVPSCEFFPLEAVKTNVLGAENVFNAAIEAGVKKVVALSTDKAVYPINAMGISKAMMERVMLAKSRQDTSTIFCGTRYGNVLGSRGSVVPLFREQAIKNEPITVTNPDMTRFMMTLDEAVDLVEYAFNDGGQGDIYVRKSPASTIADIALACQRLLQSKSEMKIIGTRHGEKLYETLVSTEEMMRAWEYDKYFRIKDDSRDMNYSKYFQVGQKATRQEYTSHNTMRLTLAETKKLIKSVE